MILEKGNPTVRKIVETMTDEQKMAMYAIIGEALQSPISPPDGCQIERFRDTLSVLRTAVGWSQKDLANQLGVTRPTIIKFENRIGSMTTVYYIAIRSVIERQIRITENNVAHRILYFLVDEEPSEKQIELYDRISKAADEIVRKVGTASGMARISNKFCEYVMPMLFKDGDAT